MKETIRWQSITVWILEQKLSFILSQISFIEHCQKPYFIYHKKEMIVFLWLYSWHDSLEQVCRIYVIQITLSIKFNDKYLMVCFIIINDDFVPLQDYNWARWN